MIKKIEVNSDDTMVVATGGSVSTSLEKHFNYEMTDKKAKTNLIKGASRETMEVEEMQKCTLIVLSVGAYHEVVIPYVLEWKVGTKVLNTEVKEIIPGYDENHKHMQTIVKTQRNSTQNNSKVPSVGVRHSSHVFHPTPPHPTHKLSNHF